MADQNLEVFTSGLFTFTIESRPFSLHKKLVSRISPPLAAMIGNGMQESRQGSAAILDCEEATFIRFVEFAYTGDYNVPFPLLAPNNKRTGNDTDEDDGKADGDGEEETLLQASRQVDSPFTQRPGDEFGGMEDTDNYSESWGDSFSNVGPYNLSCSITPYGPVEQDPPSSLNKPTNEVKDQSKRRKVPLPTCSLLRAEESGHAGVRVNWTPILLCHVQVYLFADLYGITTLVSLAAERVRQVLDQQQASLVLLATSEETKNMTVTAAAAAVDELASLIEYVFEHTPERCVGEEDKLREIFVRHAAKNCEILLQQGEGLRKLVQGGGTFVTMLVRRLAFGGSGVRYY